MPKPNPETWTPPDWRVEDPRSGRFYSLRELPVRARAHADFEIPSVQSVVEEHALAVERGMIDQRGRVSDDCPEGQLSEVEALASNMAALRDCWVTDAGVWRLLEVLAGEPIRTDPFWNKWSRSPATRRLDGSTPKHDGLDPANYRGFTAANGPHSDTRGWITPIAAYGKREKAAAVVPYRGDRWLWDHGMSGDLLLHFGRLHFHSPGGIFRSSSPSGCTVAPLWLPEGKRANIHPVAKRALAGDTVRVPVEFRRSGTEKPYVRDVLITTGCSSEVVDIMSGEPSALDMPGVHHG